MKLNKGFYRKCSLCEALCERQLISDNSITQAFTCSVLSRILATGWGGVCSLQRRAPGPVEAAVTSHNLCAEVLRGPLCLGGPRPGPHRTTRLWGGKDGAGSLGVGSFRVGTHVLAAEAGPTTRAATGVAAPGARSLTGSVGGHGEAGTCQDPLGREKIGPSGDSLRCSLDWLSRLSYQLARSERQRMRGTELPS